MSAPCTRPRCFVYSCVDPAPGDGAGGKRGELGRGVLDVCLDVGAVAFSVLEDHVLEQEGLLAEASGLFS
jgi:hypothetical protein